MQSYRGLLERPSVPALALTALCCLVLLLLPRSVNSTIAPLQRSGTVKFLQDLLQQVTYQGLLERPSVPALAVSSARLGESPKSTTTSYLPPGHSMVAGTPLEVTLKVVVLQVVTAVTGACQWVGVEVILLTEDANLQDSCYGKGLTFFRRQEAPSRHQSLLLSALHHRKQAMGKGSRV
jgi:hypothetical protein